MVLFSWTNLANYVTASSEMIWVKNGFSGFFHGFTSFTAEIHGFLCFFHIETQGFSLFL